MRPKFWLLHSNYWSEWLQFLYHFTEFRIREFNLHGRHLCQDYHRGLCVQALPTEGEGGGQRIKKREEIRSHSH